MEGYNYEESTRAGNPNSKAPYRQLLDVHLSGPHREPSDGDTSQVLGNKGWEGFFLSSNFSKEKDVKPIQKPIQRKMMVESLRRKTIDLREKRSVLKLLLMGKKNLPTGKFCFICNPNYVCVCSTRNQIVILILWSSVTDADLALSLAISLPLSINSF